MAQTKILDPNGHGHLGSNRIFNNFGVFNQKMEMLGKNKASHCKNENVRYPQGHLVTWISVYSVNDLYSLQYCANISN